MFNHESAGDPLVPAKPKNLPNRILRAFDQAMHLRGLPRGARDTLAELCRFVPQNRPFDSVFAHKKTIAERLGMSERSLYRHLATLEKHQLIEVLEQDRKSRNGRFTVARIRLTRLAAALIGLIEAPELMPDADDSVRVSANGSEAPACPPLAGLPVAPQHAIADGKTPVIEAARPVPNGGADAPTTPVMHRPPSANLASRHTLSVPTSSKHQPPQRSENGLPVDLAWLTGNGMSRAGIFKLMGMAKSRGKRLSDIVTVVREYITPIKGGQLFAYLAKLASGPTDFAMAAATERQRVESGRQDRALARKSAMFRDRFKGLALTNPQQSRLYLIDERCAFVQVFGGAYPSTAPMTDMKEWIERIETGRLVLATLATERRLRA